MHKQLCVTVLEAVWIHPLTYQQPPAASPAKCFLRDCRAVTGCPSQVCGTSQGCFVMCKLLPATDDMCSVSCLQRLPIKWSKVLTMPVNRKQASACHSH